MLRMQEPAAGEASLTSHVAVDAVAALVEKLERRNCTDQLLHCLPPLTDPGTPSDRLEPDIATNQATR